jgi:hypothetical protein
MEKTQSKPITFRPNQELEDKIRARAESKGKTLNDTICELIEAATSGEDPNRYQWLEKACPALVHANEGFHCFIKAPTKHKLGDGTNEDAKKFCTACQATKGILSVQAILAKGGISTYCTCNLGGVIDEIDPDKILCPYETLGKPISITKNCKTRENSQPCKNLQTHTIRIENIKAKTSRK